MDRQERFAEAFWAIVPVSLTDAKGLLFHKTGAERDAMVDRILEGKAAIPQKAAGLDPYALLKQIRPTQWVKNGLLFLPLLASHSAFGVSWLFCAIGFVAFSLLASAIYIVNDLCDLSADRLHPKKRFRPLASGKLSLRKGQRVAVFLIVSGLVLSALINFEFLLVAIVYLVLTSLYSFKLKKGRAVDILMLSALYAIRVIAGATAASVPATGWFLAFVGPVFLSLAAVKRLTEVTRLSEAGKVPGRSYSTADRQWLIATAILSAVGAVCVFSAYTQSNTAGLIYSRPLILLLSSLPLAVWLARMIISSARGLQDFDPITHALKDKVGLGLIAISLGFVYFAI